MLQQLIKLKSKNNNYGKVDNRPDTLGGAI